MADRLLEALMLLLVGLGGVFAALVLLAGTIWLLRSADERINAWRIQRYARRLETGTADPQLNDELVAVLAAAATLAIRKPIVIRRIKFLATNVTPSWAVTGRINIMASHSVSKR